MAYSSTQGPSLNPDDVYASDDEARKLLNKKLDKNNYSDVDLKFTKNPNTGDVSFRKGRSSGLGHVAFATGNKTDRTIEVLGGNQGNTLSVRSYQISNTAKGFGLRTIRRAVSCDDGETEAPNATDTSIAESAGIGGAVT